MGACKTSILIFCIVVQTIMQVNGKDKYTDENRPYEFGFTIDGEQHRHEKKDENGIIMGEFGFITADGVYHVTVYATDEQGRFKILSMKNIRVKPYPTAGVQSSRTGHSLTLPGPDKPSSSPSSPSTNSALQVHKQSQPTYTVSNNDQNLKTLNSPLPPRPHASPVKSCSHCSLPTTTTLAPPPPQVYNTVQTNQGNENFPNIQNSNQNRYNNNQNNQNNQNQYNQFNPIAPAAGYDSSQNNQNNQNQYNQGNPIAPETGSVSSIIGNDNDHGISQQGISGSPGLNNYNRANTRQNNQLNVQNDTPNSFFNGGDINEQNKRPEFNSNYNQSGEDNTYTNVSPNSNTKLVPSTSGPSNQQSFNNEFVNNPNQYSNSPGFDSPYTDDNSAKTPQYNSNESQSNVAGENVNSDSLSNALGNRNPKKYEPSTGNNGPYSSSNQDAENKNSFGSPNSVPNGAPAKPMLISAQMQIVDKNTDIYHKNPGERDGLPEGVTKDYMERVLYVFNYTVGFHGHYEKGYENGAKQGYYYVTGRNGVRTRVDYEADEKGFRPKISQEVLDILSDDVPKPETEKEQKYGLKSYEFKWLYFPVESKS